MERRKGQLLSRLSLKRKEKERSPNGERSFFASHQPGLSHNIPRLPASSSPVPKSRPGSRSTVKPTFLWSAREGTLLLLTQLRTRAPPAWASSAARARSSPSP